MILSRKTDLKVGFIICGAQKGGTTALDHYLRSHPKICMADRQEVHYFDKEKYFKTDDPDYSKYHAYFSPKEFHTIIGEATPIYMYWDKVMERIHTYNPEIKLIVVLRNPVYRAFSNWNMERDRKRDERSFLDAILAEIIQLNNPGYEKHRIFSYLDRGFYSRQIKQIYEYFDKKQLFIIKNEMLRNNPNQILANIANFLGISLFEQVDHKAIHTLNYIKELSNRERELLQSFYLDEISDLESLLDWDLTDWKN